MSARLAILLFASAGAASARFTKGSNSFSNRSTMLSLSLQGLHAVTKEEMLLPAAQMQHKEP